MWIMLLIFSFVTFAEEMSSEKYCFSSSQEGMLASKKLSAIQVPSDVVTQDENCLIVQMRPHRRELIQRFILSSIPGASIAFSSEDIRRAPCRLKVEKEKKNLFQNTNFDFSNQTTEFNRAASNSRNVEVMLIETLKEFQLSVDQDEIKGTCRYINPNRYEITIEVRKNPRPIAPVNQPPTDQKTSILSTQLQLSRGERVDMGGVIKSLKDKNHSLDIKPTVNIETSGQAITEKVFLSLQ